METDYRRTCLVLPLRSQTEITASVQVTKIDRYLTFDAKSTVKGHVRAHKQCIPTTSKHYEMKLNEPERQKLDTYRSRHSMQSYILTCYRLRKREPSIALSSHHQGEGGGLNLCIRGTPPPRARGDERRWSQTAYSTSRHEQ